MGNFSLRGISLSKKQWLHFLVTNNDKKHVLWIIARRRLKILGISTSETSFVIGFLSNLMGNPQNFPCGAIIP